MELRRQDVNTIVLEHAADLAKVREEVVVRPDVLERARRVAEIERPVSELECAHVHAASRDSRVVDRKRRRSLDESIRIIGPCPLPATRGFVEVGHRQMPDAASQGVEKPFHASSHGQPPRICTQESERAECPEDLREFPLFPVQTRLLLEFGANNAIELGIEPVPGVAELAKRLHCGTSTSMRLRPAAAPDLPCGSRRATRSTIARWARTEASHVNARVRARPRSARSRLTLGSRSTCSTALAICSGRCGSTKSAASAHTSGSAPVRAATTGHPRAIASKAGNPNPSYSDGVTSTEARSRRAILSASLTGPRAVTRASERSSTPKAPTSTRDPSPAITRCTSVCCSIIRNAARSAGRFFIGFKWPIQRMYGTPGRSASIPAEIGTGLP